MPASPDLAARIARMIARDGPLPLPQFMAVANAHYYATRDPLGVAGDFTTAPEISQMFGELIGLCLADLWRRGDGAAPAPVPVPVPVPVPAYVELGPGRGTLAADAVRAMRAAGLAPAVHLVETSPVLRAAQAARLPGARHHDAVDRLPADRPLLVVANEFFDALPVRQIVRTGDGWRERVVGLADGRLAWGLGARGVEAPLPGDARVGDTIETSPAAAATMRAVAARIARQGGAMIVVDYGHAAPGFGDTVQAVCGHRFADPLAMPGEQDLTAHVDFTALAGAAAAEGLRVHGPVGQGAFLGALGIAARADALARRHPDRAAEVAAAHDRLTADAQMGTLFKVLGATAPGWPAPGGFA